MLIPLVGKYSDYNTIVDDNIAYYFKDITFRGHLNHKNIYALVSLIDS